MAGSSNPTDETRRIDLATAGEPSHATITHPSGAAGATPADDSSVSRALPSPAADAFPGFEIKREIHRGGQGVVYHATRKTTHRDVALKVMHQGPFSGPAELARFELEVQILGQLRHPNIVGIHDSGTAAGNFYYVMDYIDGQRLDEFVRARSLSIPDTLRLFIRICDAVAAAHLRGVIHRDLKPGNILVDAEGEPHVLDFGLAKLTVDSAAQAEAARHVMTMTGQFVGSLPWASPEQAEGRPDKIDVRTDVYALGVILYQMLTNTFPYDTGGSLHNALNNILHTAPAPPRGLRRQLDDEVETIVLKCLQKERERRYQTAGELAQDVRRYLAGEPIEAKRDSGWYVLRKAMRRYKGIVALGLGFLLAGFAFGVVMAVLYSGARSRLEQQQVAEARRQREDAERREHIAARRLYATRIALALGRYVESDVAGMRDLLDACPQTLRGWEWSRLNWLADRSLATLRGHGHFVSAVRLLPDGRIVSAGYDGSVRIWKPTGDVQFEVERELPGLSRAVLGLAINPDATRVAAAGQDRRIVIWNLSDGSVWRTLEGHNSHIESLDYSPDGARLASGGQDGLVRIWPLNDAAADAAPLVLRGHSGAVSAVAFSADGRQIATAGEDAAVRLWDAARGELLTTLHGHNAPVLHLAFAPSGLRLASAGAENSVIVWDTQHAAPALALSGHVGRVSAVTFAADGARLFTGGDDATVRVWDAATGENVLTLRGHTDGVEGLASSRDGALLVSASRDNTLRIWSTLGSEETLTLRGHYLGVNAAAFSPDGALIASAGQDLTVKMWDGPSGEELRTIPAHDWSVRAVAFTRDGQRIISGSEDGTLAIWDAARGARLGAFRGHRKPVTSAAVLPASGAVVSGGEDNCVRIWDAQTFEERLSLTGHAGAVLCVAGSRDSRWIASGSADRTVRVWDAESGRAGPTLLGHEGSVRAVAFLTDGRLASAGDDNVIRIWDIAEATEIATLRGHTDTVRALACSPDGKRLASGGDDRTIRLWDCDGGDEILALRGHGAAVLSLAFSPDGGRLASCDADGLLKLWENQEADAQTRERRASVATARRRIDALYAELTFTDDVVARLAKEPLLDEAQRAIASRMAQGRGDNPLQLNSAAWKLASQPRRSAAEYELAAKMAARACLLARDTGAYLNTLGVAQYRAEQYAAAIETLQASRQRNGDHPADVAFIALALHRMQRQPEARAELQKLRALMQDRAFARDDLWLDFLREAEEEIDPATP